MPVEQTLATRVSRWLAQSPSAPAITYYGPGAARIELSRATAANAVHKAANLFRDELMLDPGDVVRLALPCHWQAPVLAFGAWAAGLTVAVGPAGAAAATLGTSDPPADASGIRLAVPMDPWGLPLRDATPPGWEDYAAMARSQPDVAQLVWPERGEPWIEGGGTTWGEAALVDRCSELAAAWGMPNGGRLSTGSAPDTVDRLLACTLVPALCDGGAILVNGVDMARVTSQERNEAAAFDV